MYILAYALPSAVVWSILGIVVQIFVALPIIIICTTLVYALIYGIAEVCSLPLRTVSLTWQVPSGWIKGAGPIRKTWVWGSLLGPGLITRNPYAGIWLLLFMLAFSHHLLVALFFGAGIGAAHGIGRAIGVIKNHICFTSGESDLLILGRVIRWRFFDGILLLFVAGVLAGYLLKEGLPWF